jgi:hypothetical protein
MGLDNVPRCRHVKVNGIQCGSPALRRRRYCFFHDRAQEQHARIMGNQFKQARFVVPLLEDANAVQLALMQVMQLLGSGQMEPKIAGLMLYALQTASGNLKHTKFEAEKPTDVVIDRDTVDRTCIHGPQWFAREFPDAMEETEAEENQVEENEAEKGKASGRETAGSGKVRAQCRANARSKPRKKPEPATVEEAPPPEWVHGILRSMGIPVGAEARVAPG